MSDLLVDNEWMNEWTNEWMNEWMDKWMNELLYLLYIYETMKIDQYK